jgi:hypothetical protein
MSRPNFILDAAGNLNSSNVGSTGVSQGLLYTTLIVAGVLLLVVGFIPGSSSIYNLINTRTGLLSILLLVVTSYISSSNKEKSDSITTIDLSFQIADRCKTNFISMISEKTHLCPKLINSFYFPFQKDPSTTKYKPLPLSGDDDNYTAINALCTLLYENVEDFANTLQYTILANAELLTHFATILVSPIVQKHWSVNASGYQYPTISLINDLIHIVNQYRYIFKNSYELNTFFIVYGSSTKFWSIIDNVFTYNI